MAQAPSEMVMKPVIKDDPVTTEPLIFVRSSP